MEIIAMLKCDISYITRKVCVDGKKGNYDRADG